MLRYVARRLALLIPILLGVSILVFVGMQMIPGDVAQMLLGEKGTKEDLARLRAELGLDQPLYVQYWRFLSRVVRGDFGQSLRTRKPAISDLWEALPMTLELSFAAMMMAALVGIPLGVMAATKQYSLFDNAVTVSVLFGVSMPIFWTGLILMMIFGSMVRWLPIGGILDEGIIYHRITGIHVIDGLIEGDIRVTVSALRHLLLPALALASIAIATITRMTRSTMLEILHMDYVRTARAKGLRERVVVFRHAFRNALIPVVTILGLQLGLFLSGAVLTETVFALPGLGRLAVTSIMARDYSVVQAVVIVGALFIVVINLVVDLTYAFLDPRIRYE